MSKLTEAELRKLRAWRLDGPPWRKKRKRPTYAATHEPLEPKKPPTR